MTDPVAANRTVLYAEDDPNDAFFMGRAFEKLGAGVGLKVVSNGREAIDYLSGVDEYADRARYPLPTLLLLDVKMPQLSGLEVLAWARARTEFAALPVLMFTSSAQKSDVDRSRDLGANGYLVKPSNSTHLHLLIQDILKVVADGLPADGRLPIKENLIGQE